MDPLPAVHTRIQAVPGITTAVLCRALIVPAIAQVPPAPGGSFGHFGQGIPVFWPYHVLLVLAGFVLLVAGIRIAHSRRSGSWYRTHRLLEAAGGTLLIIGILIGVYMVTLSGLPHLRNPHEVLGGLLGILVLVTIAAGLSIRRYHQSPPVRAWHRWLGRVLAILVAFNVLLGVLVLWMILSR